MLQGGRCSCCPFFSATPCVFCMNEREALSYGHRAGGGSKIQRGEHTFPRANSVLTMLRTKSKHFAEGSEAKALVLPVGRFCFKSTIFLPPPIASELAGCRSDGNPIRKLRGTNNFRGCTLSFTPRQTDATLYIAIAYIITRLRVYSLSSPAQQSLPKGKKKTRLAKICAPTRHTKVHQTTERSQHINRAQ